MDVATPAVVDTDVVSFWFMEAKNWGVGRRDLMRLFLTRFTPLLPDTETAGLWARIKINCEKKGRPITFADAWIAASAVQLNVPLATHA